MLQDTAGKSTISKSSCSWHQRSKLRSMKCSWQALSWKSTSVIFVAGWLRNTCWWSFFSCWTTKFIYAILYQWYTCIYSISLALFLRIMCVSNCFELVKEILMNFMANKTLRILGWILRKVWWMLIGKLERRTMQKFEVIKALVGPPWIPTIPNYARQGCASSSSKQGLAE